MSKVLVIYCSLSGNTKAAAEAIAEGARSAGAEVVVKNGRDAQPADLLNSDAVALGSYDAFSYMGGGLKDFFDRTYYPVLERVNGRPYAVLVCAGSDGSNAARQIQRIATGWRLSAVAEPIVVCSHAQTPEAIQRSKTLPDEALARCAELGAAFAAGLALGVF